MSDPAILWRIYRIGLDAFLAEIERALAGGDSFDGEGFAALLALAFTRYGLAPAALARDESVSKAAVSRWASGKALPTAPTRKAVVRWVAENLRRQARALAGPEAGGRRSSDRLHGA